MITQPGRQGPSQVPLLITAALDVPGLGALAPLGRVNSGPVGAELVEHLAAVDLEDLGQERWLAAPLVVLDEEAATTAYRLRFPPRPGVVVLAATAQGWRLAPFLGGGQVMVVLLPAAGGFLVDLLTGATAPQHA